jgi:hypothetical protein
VGTSFISQNVLRTTLLLLTHCQLLSLTARYCHPLTSSYVSVVCIPAVRTFRLPGGMFCGFPQPLQHVPSRALSWTRATAVRHWLVIHRVFGQCALGGAGRLKTSLISPEWRRTNGRHSTHIFSVAVALSVQYAVSLSLSLSHSHIYL